jgi:hypothetical protein
LFERHTIPHTVGRIASGRHALLLRLSAPRR